MADHCIFCKIVKKEMQASIVHEDDRVLVFKDIRPAAPTHLLIIPKEHVDSVQEVPAGSPIVSQLAHCAAQVAKQLGLDREGYRLVINNGDNGGQTVYHLHLHLLGGRFMSWPPG
jgi:histidine triad (HIT) family protein